MTKFYDFEAATNSGKIVQMSEYANKVVIVVNTASKCGLTPQYEALEALYKKYNSEGLVILGFPCNQFGNQEPGSADEIASFCQINYGVTFPIFAKIDVNGKDAHALFKWLKHELKGTLGDAIKWNFTKFLIAKDGKPLIRYAPTTKPEEIEPDIIKALKA